MDSKRLITIVIIIVALAGAGVFLYMSLTGMKSDNVVQQQSGSAILPSGNDLDFSKLKEFNPSGRKFQYPAVTPQDAGVSLGTIMKQ